MGCDHWQQDTGQDGPSGWGSLVFYCDPSPVSLSSPFTAGPWGMFQSSFQRALILSKPLSATDQEAASLAGCAQF